MVMSHPVNTGCKEVLFCMDDSEKFSTVDGFSQSYIAETMGYTVQTIKRFSNTDRLPYVLMGKALAEIHRVDKKYENEVYYEIVPYAMNEEGVIVGSSDHMSFRRANDASLIIGQDGITEIVHTEDDNKIII